MRHLVPFYLFGSLAAGIVAAVSVLLVYRKTRSRFVLWFFLFMLGMGGTTLINLVSMYRALNGLEESLGPVYAGMLLTLPFNLLYLIAGPACIHELVNPRWKGKANALVALVAFAGELCVLLPGGMRFREADNLIEFGACFNAGQVSGMLILVYGLAMAWRSRTVPGVPKTRAWFKRFIVLTALFMPGFAYDKFFFTLRPPMEAFPVIILFHPLYYTIVAAAASVLALSWMVSDRTGGKAAKASGKALIAGLQIEGLSPRESSIAALVLRGYANKQIAAELGLSVKTINNQLYALYRKLGIASRWELVSLLTRSADPAGDGSLVGGSD